MTLRDDLQVLLGEQQSNQLARLAKEIDADLQSRMQVLGLVAREATHRPTGINVAVDGARKTLLKKLGSLNSDASDSGKLSEDLTKQKIDN